MNTVVDLIAQQGLAYPDKPAIQLKNSYITYHELIKQADILANHLASKGVGPESIVCIMLDRSVEMFIAILGILKAGGAYLPIDPRLPKERIETLLEDSKAAWIITKPSLEQIIGSVEIQKVYCDALSLKAYSYEPKKVISPPKPENLAYVIYTSGSTGKPKGVMIEHRALMTQVDAFQLLYPLVPDDHCLAVASYVFDASVYEFFTSLTNACTLHVLETLDVIDIVGFVDYIVQNRITSAYIPPSVVKPFSDYVASKSIKLPFRRLIVGVEPIRQGVIEQIQRQMLEGSCLLNGYGPTESTVWSTVLVFKQAYESNRITSIGKALPGYTVLIVDEQFAQVPTGQKGQIIVGGPAVARGYLFSEALTQEKFRSGIVADDPDGRYYLTGDYALYLEDGNIEFVGRIDNQIKIKGYRVELGEVEYALENHPEMSRAVVIADRDEDKSYSLVAFYTTHTGQAIENLSDYLAIKLPAYMIPDQLVWLEKIPTTITDKVDRRALSALIPPKQTVLKASLEGNSRDRLTHIYGEILKTTAIDPKSSFFELGGDSIKAMVLMLRVYQDFGQHIQVKDFYADSSLNAMLSLVEDGVKQQDEVLDVFLTETDKKGTFFDLSASQYELYVLHQYYKSKLLHNIVFRIEIVGLLDNEKIRLSLQKIIDTHESFRTAFVVVEGHIKQFVESTHNLVLPYYDFTGKPNSYVQDFERGFGREEVDLSHPPLWRFVLVKKSNGTHYLYFLIHHLLFDGWSAGIFLAELAQVYESFSRNEPIDNKPIGVGVVDFAAWQSRQLQKSVWDFELEYWKQKLNNLPKPYKLSGYNPDDVDFGKGNRIWWSIPAEKARQLMAIAKTEGASLYVVLLSCYFILLSKLSAQKDQITTTPYANRTQPPFDQLIGYLTNMLAIRARVQEETSFEALIRQVGQTTKEAYSHAMYPYGQLVNKLGLSITQGQSPLYQTMFIMQNWQIPFNGSEQIKFFHTDIGNHTAKALLTMNVDQKEDLSLECWFEFPSMVFSPTQIETIIQSYNNIVDDLISDPKKLINQIQVSKCLKKTKSAVLIGEGAILQQCAEILINRNWSIEALISHDTSLRTRAVELGIEFISEYDTLKNIVETRLPDVVFSINNDWIISSDIIKFSKSLFINYHNSLLPKYAGLFASNWSVYNNETLHGVSWHLITDTIDAGAICERLSCEVSQDETAFTLNLKCFALAVQSFENLLFKLETCTLKPVLQDQLQRSYYGLTNRPNKFCECVFSTDASSIHRLCKSTDFGPDLYNDFGMPRLAINDVFYLVPQLEVLQELSNNPAGQVVRIESEALIVSTNTNTVRLPKLLDLFGKKVDLVDIISQHSIGVGYKFEATSQIVDERVLRKLFTNEKFWLNKLLDYHPMDFLAVLGKDFSKSEEKFQTHVIQLDNLDTFVSANQSFQENVTETLIASVALFFARFVDVDEVCFPVCFETPSLGIISSFVPVKLCFDPDKPVLSQLEAALDEVVVCRKKGSFFIDLFARHPELKTIATPNQFYNSTFAISCVGEFPKHSCYGQLGLRMVVDALNHRILLESVKQHAPFSAAYLGSHLAYFFSQIFSSNPTVHSLQPLLPSEVESLLNTQRVDNHLESTTTVIQLFKEQVLAFPEHTAIEDGETKVTYKELDKLTDRIAAELLKRGVNAKSRVAILLERSHWCVASMFGVLKTGAAYLPLDQKHPKARLQTILNEADIAHILCLDASTFMNGFSGQSILDMSLFNSYSPKESEFSLPSIAQNSLAYVIYTSGSTGKPKGVQVSHHSLVSFALSAIERYQITGNDRVLQFATPTFDAAVEEIFASLCSGACLIIRNETMVSSIQGFVSEVNKHQITVLDLPTAFWKQLLSTMQTEQLRFAEQLRLLIIGGEHAGKESAQQWLSYFGQHPRLVNTYGPTEATVVATTCYLDEITLADDFPIGKPIGLTTAWVTDRFHHLVPPGIEGQLLLGGPQVAMGYLNDEKLTNTKFIPDKFSNSTNAKLYATGDKVLMDNQGDLLFKGRLDAQVKIRGFRVDVSEVNEAILSLPEINDCITVFKAFGGAERLVSYVIPKPSNLIEEAELRSFVKGLLPDYMIPAAFVFLQAFPLTRHMKIDLNALPAPKTVVDNELDNHIITPTQSLLLAIFKQVLNQSSCSLKESFFHQGGDSLLALSVISRMNQAFGVQLTIGVLYKNPTIIALAGLLDNLTDKNPQSPMSGDEGQELVCLKSGQGLPPLVTVYFDAANKYISSLVEPNRPVYTIIPQGSDGEIIKYKSVEDMASHYLDLLEKTLPGQKIVLAGFSFGGLVALEMAIQMKSNNINLDHVVIVDTLAPYLWPKVFARKRIVLQRSYLIGIVAKACCRTIGHPIPANYRNSVILRSWRKAARNYKPTANIDVVLIKSSQSVSNEPLLGWAEYPQIQTRLRLIEGNHHGIIREYKKIVTIAEWILNA